MMTMEHLDNSPEAVERRARLEQEVQRRRSNQASRDREEERKAAARVGGITTTAHQVGILFDMMRQQELLPAEEVERIEREAAAAESEQRAERDRLDGMEFRKEKWVERCPQKFREPFNFKLCKDGVDPDEIGRVMKWEFGPKGLYVIGHTGRSKTRAMFTLLRRLYVEENRQFTWVDGFRFANEAAAAWGDCDETEKWLASVCKPSIYFIDDLAKKWTASTEEAAFALLDRRGAANKPTFITINYSGDELRKMTYDAKVLEPFLRRVKDYMEIVTP